MSNNSIEELRSEIFALFDEEQKQFEQKLYRGKKIAQESLRVAEVAHNAANILDDIDREFEAKTQLNTVDERFLWLAVALQVARQYLMPSDAFRMTASENDKFIKKIIPKSYEEILTQSVPYDAIKRLDPDSESTGLSGTTHRYRTLGHDPVLGWIFGTLNILTSTLTAYELASPNVVSMLNVEKIPLGSIPKCTSYNVVNMCIGEKISFGSILDNAVEYVQQDNKLLVVAVARQAIHFGSDYFTKQGLPIPVICSINNELAGELLRRQHIDMFSITRSYTSAVLINMIIEAIHGLFYDEGIYKSRKLFEVKTRKIIMYSNTIATCSNIISTAVSFAIGDKRAFRKLDIGGFICTLQRIVNDIKFIGEVKREFLANEFAKEIWGKDYDLTHDKDGKLIY